MFYQFSPRWITWMMFILSIIAAAGFTWWNITQPDRQQATAKAQEQARVDALFGNAERAVRNLLRDPDSAQFKSLSIRQGKDGKSYICGQVNAKNAFGGYTGFEFFAFRVANGPAYLMDEDPMRVVDSCHYLPAP